MLSLGSDITEVSGVGAGIQLKLNRLGIFKVRDLINHLPFRFEDYSKLTKIGELGSGQQTIKAKIKTVSARRAKTRGTHITEVVVEDATGSVKIVWFNQPWRVKSLKSGPEYFFSGDFGFHYSYPSMMNPSVELVSDFNTNTARILPIYRQTKGLNSKMIRKFHGEIKHLYAEIEDDLPLEVIKLNNLLNLSQAIEKLHWPQSSEDIKIAELRFSFEELFELMMASYLNKQENLKLKAPKLKFDLELTKKMLAELPFELTDDQKKASWAVMQNQQQTEPMNRLVQGDVGSGKTIVALLSALQCLNSGYQCAVIAPTEILASQHFKFFESELEKFKFKALSLTSSTQKAEREQISKIIESDQPVCIVGTHALIQKNVKFSKLGLIVIDEQHRFGVRQRQAMQKNHQADFSPHVLSLSATPIPRSMMLTVYGELDVSIIEQMPLGRKPVKTEILPSSGRIELYKKLEPEIKAGNQMFVICPRIEADDEADDEPRSVETQMENLQKSSLAKFRIEAVHGKMKPAEKEEIILKFSRGEIDILVATTVVEVGVDISNANLMIIESAENFGLAQLHQLRGRIGRNQDQAYCYGISSTDGAMPTRLRYFARENSGFKLAEYDLKLRGPGRMFSEMQSGNFSFKFTDPSDLKTINKVRDSIKLIESEKIKLNQKLLAKINDLRRVSILN
ncbi:MAG TPA: ATP-dependent DNA helicase RecG [Candidatus Saccharibacteria bacterium]|nr:ATP-dependent DNA helicase RecG [Candidatus Saccharibacteria bacterium]